MVPEIVLDVIRHGESISNLIPHYMGGREPGAYLTPRGREQIAIHAERYRRGALLPDMIIASPIPRARISATLFAAGVGWPAHRIAIDPDLEEIDLGIWSGLFRSDPQVIKHAAAMRRLGRDFNAYRGESHNDVTLRARSFLARVSKEAPAKIGGPPFHVVAISHVTTMRCMLNAVGLMGKIRSEDVQILNATTMRLVRIPAGRWQLHGLNLTDIRIATPKTPPEPGASPKCP